MKICDDEGVANRIGPEPCASNGEASVGRGAKAAAEFEALGFTVLNQSSTN